MLLYIHEMGLLFQSKVGLRRTLQELTLYCKEEQVTIVFQKSEIRVFTKNVVKHGLQINGHDTEQIKVFLISTR